MALNAYAADHDDRYPPVAELADATTGAPAVLNNRISSWISQVYRYDPKIRYDCPAAAPSEAVANEGRRENPETHRNETVTVYSTYGLYAPYGGALKSGIESPGQVVLLAETSNLGALGSLDPVKFVAPDGTVIPFDGHVIGWDNSNVAPNKATQKVTRLAFRDSASQTPFGRHPKGLHAISADGGLIRLEPNDQNIDAHQRRLWAVPPGYGR
jgi:hypothetical protein